jgi:hypothetical protein
VYNERRASARDVLARKGSREEMPGTVPLSDGDAGLASDAATADERVTRLAQGRTRVVSAAPLISERRRPKGGRHAVVGLYNYTNDRSILAVVDLDTQSVVEVRETPAQFQLHPEERDEAERLAADDSRVREFLDGREMNPLTRLYFPGALPSASRQHRYAVVFLRPSNRERRYAVVDLSERAVVDVIGPEAFRRQ